MTTNADEFQQLRDELRAARDALERLAADAHHRTVLAQLGAITSGDTAGLACFTFISKTLSFDGVPAGYQAERLDVGRYRITCLTAGISYLERPPKVLTQGFECNDGAYCSITVWTPSTTADSFEIRFTYGGNYYDGNAGGGSPNDFISILIAPRDKQ